MNHNLKSKLGGQILFGYDDVNCIEFNVIRTSTGMLNLMMDIGYIDIDDDEYPYEYGYSMQTTIYAKDLVEIGKKVTEYFKLGMFEHLVFIEESFCLDENGSVLYDFKWGDYLLSGNLSIQ